MTRAIETRGLTKFYGDSPGIVDLDLLVEEGEVFGFIGPNGAGKSTSIRTLLGFLQPTRGSATILGLDMRKESLAIRQRIGYLPGDLALYDTMTGRELLFYLGHLRKKDVSARVQELAGRLELDLDRRIRELSTGNRQKVGLINAFMHEPELLILDEPTSGLDPLIQQEFLAMVVEARAAGRTVFLSSHILPEVERVADRVGIVRKSKLIAVDTVAAFKARSQSILHIRFAQAIRAELFEGIPELHSSEIEEGGLAVTLRYAGSADALLKRAASQKVESISTQDGELEQAFLSYYAGDAG